MVGGRGSAGGRDKCQGLLFGRHVGVDVRLGAADVRGGRAPQRATGARVCRLARSRRVARLGPSRTCTCPAIPRLGFPGAVRDLLRFAAQVASDLGSPFQQRGVKMKRLAGAVAALSLGALVPRCRLRRRRARFPKRLHAPARRRGRISGRRVPAGHVAGAGLREGSAFLGGHEPCDHLLLVEERVLAGVVEGRHRGRVGEPAARGDAEVVADEGARAADAAGAQRRELRVPGMRRQADVVPDERQGGFVELRRGVDAVVRSSVGRARRRGSAAAAVWRGWWCRCSSTKPGWGS
jgi:hypothetical protein